MFVLERDGRPPFIVRGGNRILFLADKVREIDGEPALVEPLTNVWDDVPFQGIAREGGVVFSRNKKPERLVARVFAMSDRTRRLGARSVPRQRHDRGGAHKMGRRWIAIEREPELATRASERLERVVRGEDDTGITRACGWTGGGAFALEIDGARRTA